MINYESKSKIIDSPLFEEYKKINKAINAYYCSLLYDDYKLSDNLMSYNIAGSLFHYYNTKYPNEWKECKRISSAHKSRVSRLKRRVSLMLLDGECIFLTLTFTDNVLNSTSSLTRRRYVQRFLNTLNCRYIANADFGKKNGREHYHAIVQIDRIDYSQWNYGAINGIKVRNNTDDINRISRYVAKLTNHAIKATTRRSVMLYSRGDWFIS